MENREIARLLSEVADLMEIGAEDGFRIRSYRNAASTIESYPERIDDILRNPERKVTDIPGIGKGIAAVLEEIGQRGTFQKRDHLLEQYPATLLELLRIQGLGSKGVALLYQHYKVATIDDLERICKEQKLRELPRMGAKLEFWAKVPTKPASSTDWKACKWICAPYRMKATARRCNISPAARNTTSSCACAPRSSA